MKPEIIAVLIDKYLKGDISADEERTLLAWYRSMDHSIIEIPMQSEEEKEALRLTMRANLVDYAGSRSYKAPISLWQKRSYRWMAAAALTGLLGICAFLLNYHKPKPQAPLAAVNRVLTPGGNKATLTLDDGRRIVLDGAANGTIAKQGAIAIVKLDNGKIACQGTGDIGGAIYYNTLETPRGGEYQITLPDGTKVWLNSASSIKYPNAFAGKDRRVEITGEAYFDVEEDKSKPFIVSSRGMQTQVLGTEFDLMAYADEEAIKATLVKGSVSVMAEGQARRIRPGQQAIAVNSGHSIRVEQADISRTIAWKNGEFDFEGADIPTIMRQVARWYDVEVLYKGDISGIRLSGVVSRRERADQLLLALERTKEVEFKVEGKRITVMPAGND